MFSKYLIMNLKRINFWFFIFCQLPKSNYFIIFLIKMFKKYLFYNLFVYLCEVKTNKKVIKVGLSFQKDYNSCFRYLFEKKIEVIYFKM